jgi:hypothetical protein
MTPHIRQQLQAQRGRQRNQHYTKQSTTARQQTHRTSLTTRASMQCEVVVYGEDIVDDDDDDESRTTRKVLPVGILIAFN